MKRAPLPTYEEGPIAFNDVQMGILTTFDRILELSMNLFQIEDTKMQIIICGQFNSYMEMIFRMRTDRFNPQLQAMIQLAL